MGSCQDRKPGEGRADPSVPGVPRGSGSAPQAADGEGEATRGAQPIVPPRARGAVTERRTRDTQRAGIAVVAAARAPIAAAERARPSPAAQPGVTLPLPAVRPWIPASVRRSHEPRGEDEKGYPRGRDRVSAR